MEFWILRGSIVVWLACSLVSSWEMMSADGPSQAFHDMCTVNDTIYLFGGLKTTLISSVSNELWRFNISDNIWTQIEQGNTTRDPKPRYGHRMICSGNDVYVFGGTMAVYENNTLTDLAQTNEMWKLQVNGDSANWTLLESNVQVPSVRTETSLVEHDGFIYLFGGVHAMANNLGLDYSDLWRYNWTSGDWTRLLPESISSPSARYSHTASIVTDQETQYMAIFGGHQLYGSESRVLDDLWLYSFQSNKWIMKRSHSELFRSYASVVGIKNRIWIFGGLFYYRSFAEPVVFNDLLSIDAVGNSTAIEQAVFDPNLEKNEIPSRRFLHRATIWKDMMILHGGLLGRVQNDTWGLNLTTTSLKPVDIQLLSDPESLLTLTKFLTSLIIALVLLLLVTAVVIYRKFIRQEGDISFDPAQIQELQRQRGLPQKVIQKFPMIKYKKGDSKDVEEGDDEDLCPICLNDLEQGSKLRQLPCKHVFHPKCIDEWLGSKSTCPMCKLDLAPPAQGDGTVSSRAVIPVSDEP